MIKVLKFPLKPGLNEVELPGQICGRPTMDFQRDEMKLWAAVAEVTVAQSLPRKYLFYVALTGEGVPDGYTVDYLGKAGKNDNQFVVHLFQLTR